jgi:hypothetical protein
MTIVVGSPSPRTLAAVSATSHHGQWGGVTFKIGGEEGRFCSNSLKIEVAR